MCTTLTNSWALHKRRLWVCYGQPRVSFVLYDTGNLLYMYVSENFPICNTVPKHLHNSLYLLSQIVFYQWNYSRSWAFEMVTNFLETKQIKRNSYSKPLSILTVVTKTWVCFFPAIQYFKSFCRYDSTSWPCTVLTRYPWKVVELTELMKCSCHRPYNSKQKHCRTFDSIEIVQIYTFLSLF